MGRIFSYRQRGSMRQAIAGAYHEILERISGIYIAVRWSKRWLLRIFCCGFGEINGFRWFLPNGEMNLDSAVHHAGQHAPHGTGKAAFQPVSCISIGYSYDKTAILIGNEFRIAYPGIISRFGHFHL